MVALVGFLYFVLPEISADSFDASILHGIERVAVPYGVCVSAASGIREPQEGNTFNDGDVRIPNVPSMGILPSVDC